jgi:hypothetical protein
MKQFINHLLIDFPVHLNSIEEINKGYQLGFINSKRSKIDQVVIVFGEESLRLEVNSDQDFFDVVIEEKLSFVNERTFQIKDVVIEGVVYATKNYEELAISQAESVHTLRYERKYYKDKISEQINRPSGEVKFIAQNNPFYWKCVCGNTNLEGEGTCHTCGVEKDRLFAKELKIVEESKFTQYLITIHKNLFIWLVISYFFQIAYQSLLGDLLFDNYLKNQFSGVLNRIVLPIFIIFSMIGIIVSRLYYRKNISKILIISNVLIFIYLNISAVFFFVGNSYNLIFVIALNLGIAGVFIYGFKINTRNLLTSILMFLAIISSMAILLQYRVLGKFDLSIHSNGVHLVVKTEEKMYTVPDMIGGFKVAEISFPNTEDYLIEQLVISQYVEKVSYRTAIVLDHLHSISVVPENTNFYVEDNVLYQIDGSILMVPISIQSLFIDDEVIVQGPFKDLINLKSLTIGNNVRVIEDEAFIGAISLELLTFEQTSTVETIGDRAFANASLLTEVTFPISLQRLGLGVLADADSLESLTSPFIGNERETTDVLAESHDILVYFFGSNTYLHNNLVPQSLINVEFYDIEMIHNTTFYRVSNLESIVFSKDFTQIGAQSFYGTTNLLSFTIPNGVTEIPQHAFEKSGIKTITIPASVTQIQANAFKDTTLQTVIYLGDINDLIIDPLGNDSLLLALGLE